LLDEEARLLEAQIDFLLRDENLQQAYLARDREQLLEYATPLYESMNAKYRVTHFYFTDQDRVNFLRVHNPPRHGDYIGRFTTDQAEREGTTAQGIELGSFGTFTLRVVSPWEIDGELVGYVELGMEIEHLTPQLSEVLGAELIFLIDKTYLEQKIWEAGLEMLGREGDWGKFADFVIIDQSRVEVPENLGEHVAADSVGQADLTFNVSAGDRTYQGGLVSLVDAGNRDVGSIVILSDTTAAEAALQRVSTTLIAIAVAIGGVLFVFFYFYVGRIERAQEEAARMVQQSSLEIQERAATEQKQREYLEQANIEIEDRIAVEQAQRQQLEGLIIQIRDVANKLSASAAEILAVTTQQLASATEQDASINQTTTTFEQVRVTVTQTAERSEGVADTAQRSVEASKRGQRAVMDSVSVMHMIRDRVEDIADNILALSENTQQIGEIIATVNDIAEQSKLLALNASIEAARAGEEGKGFAVVALEVRNLAEQSREATEQVRDILYEIQQATNSAVMATEEGTKGVDVGQAQVEQAGQAIEELAQVIKDAALAAGQIAASTRQQVTGMDQLVASMDVIRQASLESQSSTQQAEHAVQDLNEMAKQLQSAIAATDPQLAEKVPH
jgi:methyl-accepting chemotaxis protein